MLIDFHTHIFPDKIAKKTIDFLAEKSDGHPCTDGTDIGLVAAMEQADADLCITLPVLTKPSQFDGVNRYAAEINEKYKGAKRRLISFGGIHPACEDIPGKMRFLKDGGFAGVKIHPDYQDTFIDDEGYIQIISAAKDLDMIVITHAGVDDGYIGQPVKCPPELSAKVIEKTGHKKFVLGHYGGHKQWDKVLELLCDYDVYFDTAFTLHEIDQCLFKKILARHGEDRVLFASDCPWQSTASHRNILKSYNLGEKTESKLFYENGLKLLRGVGADV